MFKFAIDPGPMQASSHNLTISLIVIASRRLQSIPRLIVLETSLLTSSLISYYFLPFANDAYTSQ